MIPMTNLITDLRPCDVVFENDRVVARRRRLSVGRNATRDTSSAINSGHTLGQNFYFFSNGVLANVFVKFEDYYEQNRRGSVCLRQTNRLIMPIVTSRRSDIVQAKLIQPYYVHK